MKKLKLLLAFCALLLGWSNASAYQTPVADGVYYLFNTGVTDGGSGFISRGENYAKRGVIDKYGIPFKLVSTGTADTYYFQLYDTDLWLSDDGFMYTDGGTDRRRAIKVESQGEGIYKLINTNNSKEVENWYGHPVGDGTGNRRDYLWQFYSIEEYEAVVAGYTSTEKSTIATTMGWDLSGTNFDSYLSTNYVGIDKTSLIEHATFDTEHSTSGWTITPNDNSSMSIGWGNEGGDKITPEFYQGYGTISQTVTVPSAGLYKVSVNAFARNANYERFHSAGAVSSVSYLKANDNKVRLCDIYSNGEVTSNFPGGPNAANNNFFSQGKYLNEVYVYVTDASKQITITLGNPSATGGCWMVFNNFKLTYYSDEVSEEDATAILNQANALANVDMLGTIKTALTDAKNTFDGARTIANYNALSTAIDNANTSKNAYANAKAYLDGAATVLEGTNVYTTSAYASYYSEPKAKYDAKTLTNEEANALTPTSTGWHSANTIDDILLSAWTIGGEQCKDFDKALYINTWSVEGNTDGSNFLTPFFEYWVADAQSLGANTLQATVTGLKASTTYSFTIRARVRQTDGQTKIANGITMKVGEGEAVDISSGAQFGTGQFYIGNFSAVGQTDEDGKLVTTITVAENSNISWLSFYNAKYTEGEDLSAYIADYEFAKTTATNNNNNAAYAAVTGKEKADLTNALTTYATVDETSKSALIAAKEALETASNTFVAAAPAYIAFAELNKTVAAKLSVSLPTITSETVAADLDNEAYIVAEYTAAKTYTKDYTEKLGAWTNAPGTNKGESWNGDANDTYYDLYNAAARAMTQTVTLPAGDYALIAKGRASVNGRLTVTVDGQTVTFPHKSSSGRGIATNGDATFDSKAAYANSNNGRGWEYRVMTFTSDGVAATTLTFDWTTASNNWCGLDDIELLCNPAALDYSALQTAYDAVELPTLGFADGEYAPYVNAANLQNIATAKDYLDNETASSQAAIDDLKTALTSMTWTANVGEVNAFYKGDFNGYAEDTSTPLDYTPNGWTATANFRVMIKNVEDYPGLADASAGTAAMSWSGGITYGEQTGYEMPLAAHTIYELTFKAAGWNKETRGDITVNVKNGSAGMVAKNLGKASKDISEGMSEFSVLFVTGETGNYVFSVSSANNMVLTDFRLVKAASQVLEFADNSAVPTYAPGTYPSVKITRSLTAGKWATAVYPFAVSGVDNIAVLNSYNSSTGELGFSSAAASTANVPFFMMSNTDKSEITLSNVAVAAASVDNATANEASLIGAYAATDITKTEKNYVLSDNKIFSVGEAGATINPYRAYIQLTEGGLARALRFVVDGQITGVDNVAAAEASAEVKDGKYIENGKVVIVKNGKKFNANGQQVK